MTPDNKTQLEQTINALLIERVDMTATLQTVIRERDEARVQVVKLFNDIRALELELDNN